MTGIFASPLRNLAYAALFMLALTAGAVAAYMAAGWSFGDALYMVVLTVYTVGFREVRTVDTLYLRTVTIAVVVLGCTGMILITGLLVQALTAAQIQAYLGTNRMKSELRRLTNHIIICGFGRIGSMLAEELRAGGVDFVVVDQDAARLDQLRSLGYLCVVGDARDEATLAEARIAHAQALATVLPDDAANVFITLSARSLNPGLFIIARGEATSTERKLRHAGADWVVLPTHIGAERIAELLLFSRQTMQEEDAALRIQGFERGLHRRGLNLDFFVVAAGSAADGASVRALEAMFSAPGFVVQIDRPSGDRRPNPPADTVLTAGDGVNVIARETGALSRLFVA